MRTLTQALLGIAAFAALLVATPPARADGIDYGTNAPTASDDAAIRQLLSAYTTAVNTGDERKFKSVLLDEQIPFTGVGATITATARKPYDDRNFADFDKAIFKSGIRYEQSFSNIRILQDGALAQVSLDFITKEAATGRGGWGWKILQLVKVDGAWKIASEFFTGHDLP